MEKEISSAVIFDDFKACRQGHWKVGLVLHAWFAGWRAGGGPVRGTRYHVSSQPQSEFAVVRSVAHSGGNLVKSHASSTGFSQMEQNKTQSILRQMGFNGPKSSSGKRFRKT